MTGNRPLDRLQYYLIPVVVVLLVVTVLVAEVISPTGTVLVSGGALSAGFIVLGFWYLLSDHERHRF